MANASVQQHVINSKTWGSTLSELSRYRELLWFFIWRDITVKYKQTFLGIAWAVLQPLGTMLIFTLLFGMVAKFPTDGIPAPIFYYAGLLPWTFFTSALTASGNSLVSNKNLISKVYFPRLALPASAVLSGLLDYFLASVILFVLILLYGVTLTWQLCLIPILIVPVVVTALGGGVFLSALNVKYRDIKYILPFLIQVWLFATPVIYPLSMVPDRYRIFLAFNPMAGPIEALRSAILGSPINWTLLGMSTSVSSLILFFSYFFFSSSERRFADLI